MPQNRSNWTPDEDEALLKLKEEAPKWKWSKIASVFVQQYPRHRHKDKFRQMENIRKHFLRKQPSVAQSQRKSNKDLKLIEPAAFIIAVKGHIQNGQIRDWAAIAEQVGISNVNTAMDRWYRIRDNTNQLENAGIIYLEDNMYEVKWTEEEDRDLLRVVDTFPELTWERIRHMFPQYKEEEIRSHWEHLHTKPSGSPPRSRGEEEDVNPHTPSSPVKPEYSLSVYFPQRRASTTR